MYNTFDPIAKTYDTDFTYSEFGKLQRQIVWKYLEKQNISGKSILEINCGTGEDALFLTQKGNTVHATDASSEMLAIAKEKFSKEKVSIETFRWDLNEPFPFPEKWYDVIFSNFGGLNCLSAEALKKLSVEFNTRLNPGGKIIFVAMGKFCLWETLYFLAKGKFRSAFRRRSKKPVSARLQNDTFVNVWYYSTGEMKTLFSEHFTIVDKKPIGIFVPPSYLENFFQGKKGLLNFFTKADNALRNVSFLSFCSDHYLLQLEKI